MLATILKSRIATDVTIAIMRAFVKMRHFTFTYEDIVNITPAYVNRMIFNIISILIEPLAKLVFRLRM